MCVCPFGVRRSPPRDEMHLAIAPSLLACSLVNRAALRPAARARTSHLRAAVPAFLPSEKVAEIAEPACVQALSAIETRAVTLPPTLASGHSDREMRPRC